MASLPWLLLEASLIFGIDDFGLLDRVNICSMAEQFQLILVGMFIGSAIVWLLTRKKVKELEKELKEMEENQKSEIK